MQGQRELDPESLGDHIDRLYRAALALCGSPQAAEDLVQDTFERVLRRPRLLRADDDIGYLLRALRNTYISNRRAARRQLPTEPLPDSPDVLADPLSRTPAEQLESRAVYEAIRALPDGFRDAVVAVDVVGLSYRQAARTLRVREATLTTRLHRGRQRVAQGLGEQDSGAAGEARQDVLGHAGGG